MGIYSLHQSTGLPMVLAWYQQPPLNRMRSGTGLAGTAAKCHIVLQQIVPSWKQSNHIFQEQPELIGTVLLRLWQLHSDEIGLLGSSRLSISEKMMTCIGVEATQSQTYPRAD